MNYHSHLVIKPNTVSNLGLGLQICHGDGLKTAVIREIPRNEWTSWHTIRMYNKMPKKYAKMIERKLQEEEAAS